MEDNQDGNDGNTPDVTPIQLRKAEKGKSTSPNINCIVKTEKRVGYTTSSFPVNITFVNILENILSNLFNAFDTDYTIAIVSKISMVFAVGNTFAKPYINSNTLFEK